MMIQGTFEESWKKVDPSIRKIEEVSDKFSLGGFSQEDFKVYFKPKELMQVYTYILLPNTKKSKKMGKDPVF